MSFKITFLKHYKKLSNVEKNQFKNKLKIFIENPTHPSLRTKKNKGLYNTWESSINMDIRIIWFYQDDELIFLIDTGHHDILNNL
ncbi:type II toxin-antitoxin system YafQ family toxin [Peptoniphilus gorbachii]|uniref:mRNA-degrading endonuclease YafQ of YafQ-DinJ toxin-antitoxin module n=1 Tax=Peptoniphilus gorbachii TaxID=411567 RepID=A0ABS2MI97_9FIRM|nr:cytotoxin [Peptoniphilus gorbachii]MBM7549717.1 mRNA-degrading endonuclease YafQ of YafQ-DinJ toxin-antitoxin module [Peptoniphilus gorbachii]